MKCMLQQSCVLSKRSGWTSVAGLHGYDHQLHKTECPQKQLFCAHAIRKNETFRTQIVSQEHG